jgi:hypothetical protein
MSPDHGRLITHEFPPMPSSFVGKHYAVTAADLGSEVQFSATHVMRSGDLLRNPVFDKDLPTGGLLRCGLDRWSGIRGYNTTRLCRGAGWPSYLLLLCSGCQSCRTSSI